MNFPEPEIGRKVRDYIAQELKKYLASERIVSGEGILIKQTAGGKTISAISQASFSGTAYVAGLRIDGLASNPSLPWVVVDRAAQTASQNAGPPPNPFPPSQEWYLKSQTFGDIHVTGF